MGEEERQPLLMVKSVCKVGPRQCGSTTMLVLQLTACMLAELPSAVYVCAVSSHECLGPKLPACCLVMIATLLHMEQVAQWAWSAQHCLPKNLSIPLVTMASFMAILCCWARQCWWVSALILVMEFQLAVLYSINTHVVCFVMMQL